VAGLGGGMVNPPLASTATSVVPPHRAGMASGINTTFRQIGIAAGIAALGSIFTAAMERNLGPSSAGLVQAVRQGGTIPRQAAAAVGNAFAAGLNDLVVITGIVALVGAVCSLVLIRPAKQAHDAGQSPKVVLNQGS